MTADHLTDYDRVLYPSYTHPQTHPNRLAVIGALFGLEPAPVEGCRVLELGCGNGLNLAPMAWAFPRSEFVGLDLAARPITRGLEMARELGLNNLHLVQGDLAAFAPDRGPFDYIIAHGMYSWVPAAVRERLLEICRQQLAPHGIAYVSYNALPGGHLVNVLREMMLFHVRGIASTEERVRQAQALIRFLAQAEDSRDKYRRWLKVECDRILDYADSLLYHDELAEINQRFYFTQFMEHALRHGLQYLGEADYFEMFDHAFPDSARQTLEQLGPDRLRREQYLDFLKCRRFRQTLLCRQEASLRSAPDPAKVAGFLVSAATTCVSGRADLRPGIKCIFEAPKGARCQTDLPAGKAALAHLGEIWPAPLPVPDLLRQIHERLVREGLGGEIAGANSERLCEFLLSLYAGGVVEFRAAMPPIAWQAGQRPVVHPLARWQAARGEVVVSLLHTPVSIEDAIGRSLLCWLDGTQERPALVEKIWALLKSRNALEAGAGGEPATRKEIESKLEENLQKLARLGLLAAENRG